VKYNRLGFGIVLGFFLLCFGGLISFAPVCGASGIPSEKSVLRYGIHTSRIGNFDPDYARGAEDFAFADMVFNSLVRYVPGNSSRLEPDLAIKIPEYELRGGKQIWTIQLRRGILFQAGPRTKPHELTAQDVVYSFQKAADPERSIFFGQYAGMKFEQVDTHGLRIIVEKPMSPLFFLPRIANRMGGFIHSRQAIEAAGYDNYKQHPVGTGPFAFSRYNAGEKLVLNANENYFRGKPLLDKIEVYFIPDNEKREAAYRSGRMDVIYGVGDPGWVEKMEKEPDTIVDVFGPGFTGLLHFNTSIKPMDDIRVRQAIWFALDRNLITGATSKQLAKQVYSPISPEFTPGGLTNEQIVNLGLSGSKDLVKARKLLTEAGYSNGFSMDLVTSEKRVYRKTYEIIKDQLAQVGIRINLNVLTHSQMHKQIRQNVNGLVLYFSFRPNADSYLRGFFHSDSIVVTGAKPCTNFSHYTQIDHLIDDALKTIHPKEQIKLWEQAQIRVLHDAMVYPLFNVNQCSVRRDYVIYGHSLASTLASYPQFDEKTRINR
jgi:peptide/nickel transport system substrate-binding protein